MAELYQVVGAILRDIAQARVASDLYTRSISLNYEQDSLLRRFPVPRADITDVEIDLKFAVSGVAVDPSRLDAKNARVSMILENYSSALTRETLDNMKAQAGKLRAAPRLGAEQSEDLGSAEAKLQSPELKRQLRSRVLQYLEDNQSTLIDSEGKLDIGKAREAVKQLTADFAKATPGMGGLFAAPMPGQEDAAGATPEGSDFKLESLSEEIQGDFKSTQEYKVEIDADATKLAQLPQWVVSTVKIKSVVRNYSWSKVETDPKSTRAGRVLVPDN